jgi:UDP-glucose 4-epimerase
MNLPVAGHGGESVDRAYRNKVAVVTGATGYLGSLLTVCLEQLGSTVVRWQRADALDAPAEAIATPARWAPPLIGADYVFHLAALEHRHGHAEIAFNDAAVNMLSTLALLEACREGGRRPTIVFASSANLVGHARAIPTDESVPDDPMNLFAIHKLTSEHYLRHYGRRFGIVSRAVRLPNVYGPSPSHEASCRPMINRLIKDAVGGEPLRLFRNRAAIRDYLFVSDAVSALLAVGAASSPATHEKFVVGSGVGVSFLDLMRLIADRVTNEGMRRPVIVDDDSVELEPIAHRDFVADAALIRRRTGWTPEVSLGDGITRTIAYFAKTVCPSP